MNESACGFAFTRDPVPVRRLVRRTEVVVVIGALVVRFVPFWHPYSLNKKIIEN